MGLCSPAEAEKHIDELELKAVFALCSTCDNVRNKYIRILSDNTTTVYYINNMGDSKSRAACKIIEKKIWQFALQGKNFLSSAHLPGKQNMLADRESSVQ